MDINDLRGLSTAFLMFAFIGMCFWAYSGKRSKEFAEAADLPFADEKLDRQTAPVDVMEEGQQ